MNVILSILNEDVSAFKIAVTSAGLKAFALENGDMPEMFTDFRIEYGHPRSLFMLGKSFEVFKCKVEREIELQNNLQQLKELLPNVR